MLPEVGGSELIVLAAVALIVVGPKDLPVLLRRVGQFVRKLKLMAADFRASFDDMARQSELDDLRKEVEALRQTKLSDTLGPVPTFDEINEGLSSPPAVPYDDTQDKLDAGYSPEDAALMAAPSDAAPSETASILPPAETAAPAAAKPKARSRAKTKAAAPESEA